MTLAAINLFTAMSFALVVFQVYVDMCDIVIVFDYMQTIEKCSLIFQHYNCMYTKVTNKFIKIGVEGRQPSPNAGQRANHI